MEKKSSKRRAAVILSTLLAATMSAALALMSGCFSFDSCKSDKSDNENSAVTASYTNPYASATQVGYSAEYLGTVKRNIPKQTQDEGLVANGTIPAYPTYGSTLSTTKEQREAIIAENSYISAKPTNYASGTYDKMDENGYLYLKDGTKVLDANGKQRQLYKHTASTSMYYGTGVSDDEPGIIKRVTLSSRGYGSYSVTGVYAPAGEVVKVQISEADMNATGGLTVYIGQVMYSSYPNNIGSGVNPNRMPILCNTMVVTKETATLENGVYTAYVGSYLGGPIYIGNTSETVTVTLSGGVRYSHFILGYTTKEEFEENAASSAPYFDMEVREYGVLHSGPKKYAESFSYDEIYDAAVLWEKISLVSTQGNNMGIACLYDTYIVNGYYAVSFVGWRTSFFPASIMGNALNAKAFTNSGAWAIIHEYNHHFQHYGAGFSGASDEITNNALNLVEYSLYTTISGNRGIGNYGSENLTDWSRYLSATWSLEQVLSRVGNTGNQNYYKTSSGLPFYATLLNNLGQDNFMQAKVVQQSTSEFGVNYEGYLGALTEVTHYNMSYFFNDIIGADVSDEFIETYTKDSYPMFVPISSVYETGRSITYDGEKSYTDTMQPYKIPYGQDFSIDLSKYTMDSGVYSSGSIVLPDGFSYKIKNVSQPSSGKITKVSDYVYNYTPGTDLKSGKIYVTLDITKDDKAFDVEDVELVLEFEQSHEVTKNVLERTVYDYTDNFYDSSTGTFTKTAADIFKANYEGYKSKVTGDNSNPVNASNGQVIQNCNTDVWFVDTLQNDGNNTNDGVADSDVKTQVVELSGKLYASEEGKYRIAIRGRKNVALFISLDGGKTYELAAEYTNTSGSADFPDTEGTYKDLQLEADSWVYFKAVLVRSYGEDRGAFMGVGWGKWTEAEGEVDHDAQGNETDESVAASVSVSYATGYRASYEKLESEEYTRDYLYKRNYSYTYSGITTYDVGQTYIAENSTVNEGWGHKIDYLFDGDNTTYYHSGNAPTENNKFIIEAKLDSEVTANRVVFDGSHNSENKFLPKSFKLWVSKDGTEWQLACNTTNSELSSDGWQVTAALDDMYTFSYYKVEITDTHKEYIALRKIIFQKYVVEIKDGKQITPDDDMFTYVGKWDTEAAMASFGHVYVGKKDATVEFEFEGTRLGILSVADLGTNYKVEIDGKEVSSIDLIDYSGTGASFVSEELSSGKHTVKITCLDTTNIDSIVIW
jgi:hypothetical protein